MSLLRSLVASTSALPASATAACSTSSVRCLATTTPEASSSTSSSRPSGPSMGARWAFAVPKAVKARLPPVVVPRGPDQPKPVCPPKAPLETPAKFIAVIGRGIEKKLKGKIDLETMAWEDLMNWRGKQWYEKGGLETKDRRYLMWIIEMYKKGSDPRRLAIEPKKPKKYRAWGDAVQDGVRIPGARFKMDLTHARRPFGLPGFPFRGFKRE